ncbi:MAG: hypothetical protein M3Q29_25780 [Chloroflexota bacterium]|nr:hypothetical protein [Chloroflexota bacterium]
MDGSATVTGDQTVLAWGVVNGLPVEDGEHMFIPVFSSRDNGREPTTIYVNESNIMERTTT